MEWRPIFKQGSLPYNEGERFLARINECSCGTEEVNVNKCLQSRPCIRDFLVVNEFNFFYVKDTGRRARSTSYSKGGIITRYKKWKMIYPDIGKREDVFVCTCSDIAEKVRLVLDRGRLVDSVFHDVQVSGLISVEHIHNARERSLWISIAHVVEGADGGNPHANARPLPYPEHSFNHFAEKARPVRSTATVGVGADV